MLFNSYEFIFLFLPLTLLIYYFVGERGGHKIAMVWLVSVSLFFYGWWNPAYLGLILGSMLFNYAFVLFLNNSEKVQKKFYLLVGIAINIGLLSYFKYANFFVDNLNYVFSSNIHLESIILPLAISFFTFQQITYLVDAYRSNTREYDFLHYCLFVTFFPQLIAGPIVHHSEMMPQFAKKAVTKVNYSFLASGIAIFVIGLFKKVVIADSLALYANPVFTAAESGEVLSFYYAWGGVLAYTFQLYFDFSGYADMAVGIARMFGIRLPLNFNSPYKAVSIIDFWRRWHMTLSRFLRDYIYIPMGGNRKGKRRRYINIFITMLLGGLWHGAGWTFIAWGALHGIYLIVNHAWRSARLMLGYDLDVTSRLGRMLSIVITFIAVVISWVFFRASDLVASMHLLDAMFDLSSALNLFEAISTVNIAKVQIAILIVASIVVWGFPNSQHVLFSNDKKENNFYKFSEGKQGLWLKWRPGIVWGCIGGLLFSVAIILLERESEFLYFRF